VTVDGPRIALCHEWLTTYGGSEQVAARIASVLGIRDVFTFTARPQLAERLFPDARVHVLPLGDRPSARSHWQRYLPMMGAAWSHLDLRGFDVVVTSSHSCVNAIRVPPGARHVSYCHTPMRYAWTWRQEIERIPTVARPLWPVAAAMFRSSDRRRAGHVDRFVANSEHVAARIRRAYTRPADVIYPPVDVSFWTPSDPATDDAPFLVAGRLVAYKRAAIAVDAARMARVPLVVAGDGPELSALRERALGADVRFVVRPDDEELRELYRTARALVAPGVEDFGMTMIEAQGCGTPVLAYGVGGAREAVVDGASGRLYGDPSAEGLAAEMLRFRESLFDRAAVRASAERFRPERFDEAIRAVVLGAAPGRPRPSRDRARAA
jgi:glycosyltransferase involved in cell wall biosynthesis